MLLVLVLVAPGVLADDAFERIEAPARTADPVQRRDGKLVIVESSGAVLSADSGGIRRATSDGSEVLRCDEPGGTGTILDATLDPTGQVLLAAENGLFIVDPGLATVERFSLGRGAPENIRSIAVGSLRRLWFITADTFGCIHLGGGRPISRFTADDGLPAPSYERIRIREDGSVILQSSEGHYRYRPDAGSKPAVKIVAVNGAPFAAGRTIQSAYGKSVGVQLSGAGRGTLQYRVIPHERGRYSARAADKDMAKVKALDPGLRTIRLVALDRDLRQSEAVTLSVLVQWPWYFTPSFVLTVGLAGVLLVVGLTFWIARRAGGGSLRYRKAAVSAVLLIFLGMQCVSAIAPHARGWPFVGWGMYVGDSTEGDVVGSAPVEAIRRDGSTERIYIREQFRCYESQVARPLIDECETAGPAFVQAYNKLHPDNPIVGVQMRTIRFRLHPDGPVRMAPRTRSRYVKPREPANR
jgi:hypothetical protein